MKIVEVFRSVQGEGPLIGTPSIFIRFAGCNLRCVYCDTKYSWDGGVEVDVDTLVRRVLELGGPGWVTLTGGEPLIQRTNELEELLERLRTRFRIAIETNATVATSKSVLDLVDLVVASPKLRSFNPAYPGARLLRVVDPSKLWLKFVVTSPEEDIKEIASYLSMGVPIERVILQPNYYVIRYEDLVKYVIEKGLPYRVLPQLHKVFGLP